MSKLHEFLNESRNSLVREALVKNKLFFDAKVYFASRGTSILAYESEYDRDGFDIIFDELGMQRHFQIKSVLYSSPTARFKIHRSLLRPNLQELNFYPLSHDSFGAGYGGGVILVELAPEDDQLDVTYYYTDGLLITAFYAGVLEYKYAPSHQSALRSFLEFQNPNEIGGQISLTKSCFVKAKSIGSVFALSGFQVDPQGGVRFRLLRAIGRRFGYVDHVDRKVPFEGWRNVVLKDLDELIDMKKFKC